MTTLTTGRHSTSTIAWRFTSCTSTNSSTECKCLTCLVHFIHIHIFSSSSLVRTFTHDHHHGHPCGCYLFDLTSSFYLFTFLLSVFLSLFFHLSDEQQPELNKKIMENLCDSANNGGEGTYDVLYLTTGYEPNFMAFNELGNSSGSFSYIIPSSDHDMDDVTLGKLLTEAHRGQADYCDPRRRVSQSVVVVCCVR